MKPNPTQIIADIEKLNSDFKASSKALLEAAFIALDDLKGINYIDLKMYTPRWNDGDPCCACLNS